MLLAVYCIHIQDGRLRSHHGARASPTNITYSKMAVLAVPPSAPYQGLDISDLKAKTVVNNVEIEITPKPPVADNFMYDFKYNHDLPTIGRFGVITVPNDCDAKAEATALMSKLSEVMGSGDASGFAGMFLESGKFSLKCELSTYLRATRRLA